MIILDKTKDALSTGMRMLMPTCREVLRLQSSALERPLPPARRPGLWLHLLLCKWCRYYGQQIQFLRRAAHEHPEQLTQATSQQLSPEARVRIRQKLRANMK
jgi:hypothetical protein